LAFCNTQKGAEPAANLAIVQERGGRATLLR